MVVVDLDLIADLVKAKFGKNRLQLHVGKPLVIGGVFSQGIESPLKLGWMQMVDEKYRGGFRLFQRVRVKNPSNEPGVVTVGYIVGWAPYYKAQNGAIVHVAQSPTNYAVSFGYDATQLEPV